MKKTNEELQIEESLESSGLSDLNQVFEANLNNSRANTYFGYIDGVSCSPDVAVHQIQLQNLMHVYFTQMLQLSLGD